MISCSSVAIVTFTSRRRARARVCYASRRDVADRLDAGEGKLAIDLVAIEHDGMPCNLTYAAAMVRSRHTQVLPKTCQKAFRCLASKQILSMTGVILCIQRVRDYGLQPVEWHRGDSAVLLVHHDVDKARSSFVGIDHDMEQPNRMLNAGRKGHC